MNYDRIYITTSIPYVNSKPHIGHALELVQADSLARYHRSVGRQVILQTGTDENASKNVLAARAAGLPTQTFVDRNAGIFRDLVRELQVSADQFIRTTEERHRRGVIAFWDRIAPEDLLTRKYSGLYCVGCEDFFLEKDLNQGLCPDHQVAPVQIEEENVFFRLSRYQSRLEELVRTDRIRIVPEKRKNEVLAFIRSGLQDISVTRSAERTGHWGIQVPGRPDQVIYVWIDALINYLTGQGFGTDTSWERVWSPETRKIHVIGKNVWKFHAVYWPALLLSAGLPLPDEIFVHGFLTENGRKISKSLGNAVDPSELSAKFGSDGLRHFLLKAVSPFEDADFSSDRLKSVYTSELSNGLGNLVSRLTRLCEKAGFRGTPILPASRDREEFEERFRDFRIDEAARVAWRRVDSVNSEIARVKPWELLGAQDSSLLQAQLASWLGELWLIAEGIAPFLPGTAGKIQRCIESDPLRASEPLFPRIV